MSPFYHFNRAHYVGNYDGTPDPEVVIPEDNRGSNYLGGVVSLAYRRGRHNFSGGVQVFAQHDNQFFGIVTSDGSNPPIAQREALWGGVEALFLEDQFKLTHWLTLNGGVRLTHFGSSVPAGAGIPRVIDNAADPRIGAAMQIPKLHWVARAFWGRYYQAPPLSDRLRPTT